MAFEELMKKIYSILAIIFVALIVVACTHKETNTRPALSEQEQVVIKDEPVNNSNDAPGDSPADTLPVTIPEKLDLKIAFGSQAPKGDWGLPYQEACEEAALIGAYRYLNDLPVTEDIMDVEINKLVKWEINEFGTYSDTSLDEIKLTAEKYFGMRAEISNDVTVENIRRQLAAGKVVLIPAAGRLLGNPYYTGAGPIYHVIILRGYDGKNFITNDVGTRTKGDGYKFKYDTIIRAIHDLPLKEDGTPYRFYDENMSDAEKASKILTGEKRILILDKE
jgi:hypothetical protein